MIAWSKLVQSDGRNVTVLAVVLIGLFLLSRAYDRTGRFHAQAEAGQPIVRAIEAYHTQEGIYPASLVDLVPKYLPLTLETPGEAKHRFAGWEYRLTTEHMPVSYKLRFYMGKGGVEYEPPNWFGNDEGHRTIVLTNH